MNVNLWQKLALLLVSGVCLAACTSPAPSQVRTSESTAYVLAGQNVAGGFEHNALVLFDAQTWAVQRSVELPHSWAQNLARDPNGKLWVGFSGTLRDSDDRLQIYSPDGDLIKTLHVCVDPEAGISFAAGRAFVACAEDGLSGKLVVIDLDSLEVKDTLSLALPDAPLLLIANTAGNRAVVLTGLTRGPEDASYAVATVIDPLTLALVAQIPLGENTDVWRILPYKDRFYLLNAASYRQPRQQANDVLVLKLDPTPAIEPLATAASPLWGAIEDGVLYAYHNPTWNSTVTQPQRQVSRLDLDSGQFEIWSLPGEWNASDLAFVNGQIVLVKWEYWSGDDNDGLYRFDPTDGSLSLLLNVPDASGLLPPRQ